MLRKREKLGLDQEAGRLATVANVGCSCFVVCVDLAYSPCIGIFLLFFHFHLERQFVHIVKSELRS